MAVKTEKIAKEILAQLAAKKYSKIDELWLQLLESPPTQGAFYKELTQQLVKIKREAKVGELIGLAVAQWVEQERYRDALRVIQIVLNYCELPEEMHEQIVECARKVYADRANLNRFLGASGILQEKNLRRSFLKLRMYLMCDEGQVFQHQSRGVGLVRRLDEREGEVELDFGDGRPAVFSFEGVRQYLKAIPDRHYLSRRARDPQALKASAHEDAVGFLKGVLRDFGGKMRQKDLKALLSDNFFSEREWASWWSKHGPSFRLDPYLDTIGSSNPLIAVREEPRSFHEECAQAFEDAATWAKRHDALRLLGRVVATEAVPPEAAARLVQTYEGLIASLAPEDVPGRLEAGYLGQDLRALLNASAEIKTAPDPKEMLRAMRGHAAAIQALEVYDHQAKALEDLSEALPEWADVYGALFVEAAPRLAQTALRALFARGMTLEATEAIESLFARPTLNPEVFVWACQQILEGKWSEVKLDIPEHYIVICLLDFMEALNQEVLSNENAPASLRNALSKIRSLLMQDGHAYILRVAQDLETEDARHFLSSITTHKALTASQKLSIETALRNLRSDFETASAAAQAAEAHFVTAQAIRRVESEYQQIKSVEIPANSHAIGRAAAMGDISDNADYEAAKAKQKQLFKRVEELHDLLSRARPFDVPLIRTDVVSPGVRVRLRNVDANVEETYSFLGIWDTDLEKHILSYASPFASQFLGKRVGESFSVSLPSGETHPYEVLAIENALAQSAGEIANGN